MFNKYIDTPEKRMLFLIYCAAVVFIETVAIVGVATGAGILNIILPTLFLFLAGVALVFLYIFGPRILEWVNFGPKEKKHL